jgi:hypothetical protein
VQAKDQQIQELRAAIQQRDNSLQKFIKLNGSLVQNPKEEPYNKVVLQNYERAQILQEEKIGLVDKAAALVSFEAALACDSLTCISSTAMSNDLISSSETFRTTVHCQQTLRCLRCLRIHLETWFHHYL